MPVSFAVKDQIHGGLIINDVDGILRTPRFQNPFTYPNSTNVTCALVGELELKGGDRELIFWSVGPCAQWEVINDGKGLESTKSNSGTMDNSNLSKMLQEYERIGGPAVGADISVLDDLEAHWVQVPSPYQGDGAGPSKQVKTMPAPSAIIRLAGDKKPRAAGTKPTVNAAASTATGTAAATATGNDMDNEAATTFAAAALDLIKAAFPGESFAKSAWGLKVASYLSKVDKFRDADQPTKDAAQRVMKNSDFFTAMEIAVDDAGKVTMPGAKAAAAG